MDEETISKGNDRIKELQDQESTLALQLAALEGSEFAIMEFTKAKVDAIERRINGKFRNVRFKMFTQQVNGGEAETCETLVNSNGSFVPFPDANNAARINAGIDIINTLCQHYDVYAPIFIDNRESVTKLIDVRITGCKPYCFRSR
jgi:exonuclease SbcC